jgi:heme-degrading monooxygenase HmoA
MNVLVSAQHHLLPSSEARFREIFARHYTLVATFSGFRSMRYAASRENADRWLVLLEFQDEASLMHWRQSDAHTQIAADYGALWAEKPTVHLWNLPEIPS